MQGQTGAQIDLVAVAHARLLADRSIQFAFATAPRYRPPPHWLVALLQAIARAVKAAAPAIRIGVWVVLAMGVAVVAYVIVRQWLAGPERRRSTAPLSLQSLGEQARAAAARAAVRLADADRLAAEGDYTGAVHLLLLRGVEEVDQIRPGRIRPSSTSRDIAALPDLPPEPRAAFTLMARAVEYALFGGRPMDAEAWGRCRDAYAALVRPEAWAPRA